MAVYEAQYVPSTSATGHNLYENEILFNGVRYKGVDAVGVLCRELKEGVLKIYRKDMLCLTVNDISKRALKSLSEPKNGYNIKYVPYTPFNPEVFNQK